MLRSCSAWQFIPDDVYPSIHISGWALNAITSLLCLISLPAMLMDVLPPLQEELNSLVTAANKLIGGGNNNSAGKTALIPVSLKLLYRFSKNNAFSRCLYLWMSLPTITMSNAPKLRNDPLVLQSWCLGPTYICKACKIYMLGLISRLPLLTMLVNAATNLTELIALLQGGTASDAPSATVMQVRD